MKKPSSMLILIISTCSQLAAMEPLEKDAILQFNIGGYKWDVSRQTVDQFGGSYLNSLLSGNFAINRDQEGRIFIDRPQKEAKLLQYFLHNYQLPTNFDENIARSAADYFGIESMEQWINEQKPKMSEHKIIFASKKCNECGEIIPSSHDLYTTIQHLIDSHKALIEGSKTYPKGFSLMYRVPEHKNKVQVINSARQ